MQNQTAGNPSIGVRGVVEAPPSPGVPLQQFPPLELVTRPNLTTAETAHYLNRRPQTLRGWACRSGTGPMVPKRIGGILAWPTATVKTIAGVA